MDGPNPRDVFRIPGYLAFWSAYTVSGFGTYVTTLALQVLVLDGATLDGLLRKTGLLREDTTHPLAGRMAAVLDVVTRLPIQVWYEEDDKAHDQRFWLSVIEHFVAECLL